MSALLIVGAGGHGCVVAEAADASQTWSDIQFVDDVYPEAKSVAGWDVLGTCSDVPGLASQFDAAVVAIGNNRSRLQKLDDLSKLGITLATVIHPSSAVSRLSSIGAGSVVLANAVVSARTSIGRGCVVNSAAVVDHDCTVGCGVHLAPGALAAGGVTIGDRAWVGLGARIREQTSIGRDVIVGAGAVVVENVPDSLVVAGVPAREIEPGAQSAKLR